jgi:ADP-heptose:LPS heptosyltransferase
LLRGGISPAAWRLYAKTLPAREQREAQWPPRRIYFAFPYFSVGDAVLAIPLLERMHALWPDAEIDVAIGEPMAEVMAALPFVHRVDPMVRPVLKNAVLRDHAEAMAILRQFRRSAAAGRQYDLAVAPRWSGWDGFLSAYQAYLTGAAVRCGYSHKAYGGGMDTDGLLTCAASGGEGEHESQRYARLLARCGLEPEGLAEYEPAAGIASLKWIAVERVRAGVAMKIAAAEYAVVAPGATSGRRMWPVERFGGFVRWAQRQGMAVVALGSAQDAGLCDALAECGAESLAGGTSVLEMLDVIAGARLFVGNDSGPGHLAGGLGVTTLVVSPVPQTFTGEHVNAPSRFRPTGARVRVLQPEVATAPCLGACEHDAAHCILEVHTEQVIAAANELIAGAKELMVGAKELTLEP